MKKKKYIIPIFIPHFGCSHQCIFCNQKKITGQTGESIITPENVNDIIEQTVSGITQERQIEVAFYGGSFTALDFHTQTRLLQTAYEALQAGKIHAIRLSTRPDAINEKILRNLLKYQVGTVELGVQSLDEKVLQSAARGHTASDVFQAVGLIKKTGIACGIQLMPGLPGEDWASLILTARQTVLLAPDFARIYPAVVIAGTTMADLYDRGLYRPLSLDEAVAKTAYLKLMFARNNIPVIRAGLQATEELAKQGAVKGGPYHPAFGEMADAYLFYIMTAHFIEEAEIYSSQDSLLISHHPKDASKIRGVGLGNIKKLKDNYGLSKIQLKPDGTKEGELIINYKYKTYTVTPNLINLI